MRIEIVIMADMNPSHKELEKRITTMIPLGLSNVWVKLKGHNAFNLGEILGFTFSEWEYLMDSTGVITGTPLSPTKLKRLSRGSILSSC